MPDWFYRTISQPLLFRLPATTARDLALGMMGRLARLPLGSRVVDFLGHMEPDPRLRCTFCDIEFPSALGLGPGLDGDGIALPALARFGMGFLELGPVTIAGAASSQPLERRVEHEAVWLPDPPASLSLQVARPRLAEASRLGPAVIVRLGAQAAEDCVGLIGQLSPHVHLFSLEALAPALAESWSAERWEQHVRPIIAAAQTAVRPLLLCVPSDAETARADPLIDAALCAGVSGVLVDGTIRDDSGGRRIGLPAFAPTLEWVRALRQRHGPALFLLASGGIHEPEHALAMRDAGANLLQLDTGLVYSGPGLPKRINDALLFDLTRDVNDSGAQTEANRPAAMSWFWTFLMGAGMLVGSILALAIAATRVVLPYDEAFLGMNRAELVALNPRLLLFMAHDRVSLAGTMIAIGILYIGLSLYGVRRGLHWAQLTIFISAFTGFASFFSFLGFGYFDTFHAFVTLALLQLLLLGVHSRLGTHIPESAPPLRGDACWRRSLWGQFLLIVHGFGLLGAGVAISAIGMSHVFVHEDLAFMQTTTDALIQHNPRLVPVVAHDRETFGGMLLASGWAFLLPALWGWRNGSAWLWWTMLLAGLSAYSAAIGVHFAVGYTDWFHLTPAFAGFGLFLVGLGLSRSFLCRK